jgi:hypothetical protein
MGGPWWAESSLPWLDAFLRKKGCRIFEYGSGASTRWLAERCAYMRSVEHDKAWWGRADGALKVWDPETKCVFLRPLDHTYETAIWEQEGASFDLVIVDGRRRVECVKTAKQFVKHGGYLVLDDSQRERYKPAWGMLSQWSSETFKDDGQERTTTIFKRPWDTEEHLGIDDSLPPFFIPVRDRYTTLAKLLAWLDHHSLPLDRVGIIDNGSTHKPMLKFLESLRLGGAKVVRPDTNIGARGLFKSGGYIERIVGRDKPFFISDPDILPAESCFPDLLQHLVRCLARYPLYAKVGLSLRTDDIPDGYPLKKQVQSWEKRFWKVKANAHFYNAEIATTFCLVRSLNRCDALGNAKGACGRTTAPNIGIHESWYFTEENMPADEKYYLENVPQRRPGTMEPGSTWVPGGRYSFGWTGSP